MKRVDFEGMCEISSDGQMVWVENIINRTKGRVVGCDAGAVEVEVDGERRRWDHHVCNELTHGYRVNYSEVKKYPHEYDSHLD